MDYNPPPPRDSESARARQYEVEEKAARYSQLHPEYVARETSVGVIRRALSRIRAALAGRR
jgi:hypothetical protein